MASIKNDDLLLVNSDREGHNKSYKIDGELFKKEFGSFYVDDAEPPIIDFVELEARTPNSSFRFENETFDFRTTMLQPGDPLPGYGLKASVGGALYEDLIITDKIIDVEGGGIDTCETDQISSVLILSGLGVAATSHTTHDVTSTLNDANFNKAGKNLSAGTSFLNVVGDRHAWTKMEFADPSPLAISPSGRAAVGGYTRVNVFGSETGNSGDWIHITSLSYGNTAGGTNGDQTPVKEVPTTKGIFKFYALCINNQNVTSPDQTPANYGGTFHYTFQQVSDYGTELTFPSSNGFDCFEPGDVVQSLGRSAVFFAKADNDATNNLTGTSLTIVRDAGLQLTTAEQSVGNQPLGHGNSHLVFDLINAEGSFIITTGASWTVHASTNGINWSKENAETIQAGTTDLRTWLEQKRPGSADARYVAISWATDNNLWSDHYDIKVTFNQDYIDAYNAPHTPSQLPTLDNTEVKIISKDEDEDANTITVDGGNWKGDDNGIITGDPDGQTTLVKETLYDTKLTVDSDKNLADIADNVLMTDGDASSGLYTQTPYKLVTTDIESVAPRSSTESLYTLDRLPTNLQDVLDNATLWNSGDPLSSGGYIIRVNDEGVKGTGYLFATNPSGDLGLMGGSGTGGSYSADGSELSDKPQSYTPTEWTLLAFSADAPDPNDFSIPGGYYSFYTHPSVAYQVFLMYGTGVNVGGVTTADSLTDIKLTFPGDVSTNPDLQYFLPGDVVQEGLGWDKNIVWEGTRTGEKAFDGQIASSSDSCLPVASSLGGLSVNSWRGTIQTSGVVKLHYWNQSSNAGQRIVINGFDISLSTADNTILEVDITSEAGNLITEIDIYRSVGTDGAIGIAGIEVNGSLVIRSDRTDVTVISTGYPDSNTMVVDGGN